MEQRNPNNFCIIMAGGFGSRFWPLCSVNKPKQFIDLIDDSGDLPPF